MNVKDEYEMTERMVVGVFDFDPDQPRDENGRWTNGGWTYEGAKEHIDKLEKSLGKAASVNKINAIAKALREQDDFISKELTRIERGETDVPGDRSSLMTLRRRVRQLMRKAVI